MAVTSCGRLKIKAEYLGNLLSITFLISLSSWVCSCHKMQASVLLGEQGQVRWDLVTVEHGAKKKKELRKSQATCPWGRKINREDSELFRQLACQKSYMEWLKCPCHFKDLFYKNKLKWIFLARNMDFFFSF